MAAVIARSPAKVKRNTVMANRMAMVTTNEMIIPTTTATIIIAHTSKTNVVTRTIITAIRTARTTVVLAVLITRKRRDITRKITIHQTMDTNMTITKDLKRITIHIASVTTNRAAVDTMPPIMTKTITVKTITVKTIMVKTITVKTDMVKTITVKTDMVMTITSKIYRHIAA